jgi:hypothetical protein
MDKKLQDYLAGLTEKSLRTSDNMLIHSASKKKNAEFSNKMKAVAAQRGDEYHEALRQGCNENRDNSYQARDNARPEKKAKISSTMTGKKKSAEHEAKVAARNRERSKPIMTVWGEFPSRRAAVDWAVENTDIVNVAKKIDKWLKTDPTSFYYL